MDLKPLTGCAQAAEQGDRLRTAAWRSPQPMAVWVQQAFEAGP